MSENEFNRLLEIQSKHSQYQEIHSSLNNIISEKAGQKRKEKLRADYFQKIVNFNDKTVLDIGANSGFFVFSSIESGARKVTAYEPNSNHADFILQARELTKKSEKIEVINNYFDFSQEAEIVFDIILCLNVLHHIGDDYGDKSISQENAKNAISNQIKKLATFGDYCFFQLGFNWKGDIAQPLFQNGTKQELIDFVYHASADYWKIKEIAIFDPIENEYKALNSKLLLRFEDIGEFLNRPIFLLEKIKDKD
jgi:SAM-dependent methyltransferase